MQMFNFFNIFDNSVLNFIQSYCRTGFLDYVMKFASSLGNGGAVWIIIALGLAVSKKYRKSGLMILGALLLSAVSGDIIIKNLVRRPRPCTYIPAYRMIVLKPDSYSFPSGHTAASFAAAGIFLMEIKRYRLPVVLLACLIAFSRMYLYVHYPTDVLGGIVLGLLCSYVIIKFVTFFTVKFRKC